MQDSWTARKAEDRNSFKNVKTIYDPPTQGTAFLLSADGITLLTEEAQILQRWPEHFRGVFNRPSAISDAAIARPPQLGTKAERDHPPLSLRNHQGRDEAFWRGSIQTLSTNTVAPDS
nr:unnamed protein product [Spirometra erinaceieuropaei]